MNDTLQLLFSIGQDITNSNTFYIFLLLVFLDVFLGKSRAFIEHEFNSYIGLKGLAKHSAIFILVSVVSVISRLLGHVVVAQGFVLFYILDYAVSIIENLELLKVPLPDWVKKHISGAYEKEKRKDVDLKVELQEPVQMEGIEKERDKNV